MRAPNSLIALGDMKKEMSLEHTMIEVDGWPVLFVLACFHHFPAQFHAQIDIDWDNAVFCNAFLFDTLKGIVEYEVSKLRKKGLKPPPHLFKKEKSDDREPSTGKAGRRS
jgi:hypothetical protein